MNYPTRIYDNQIWFGSGSAVNADDIPETSTRFWLTNSLQAVSGSKIFANDLNMNLNSIINVVDPTADQDAATKKYVDDNTGSNTSATLDDVCNNGALTNNTIQISGSLAVDGSIRTNKNMYIKNNYLYMNVNSNYYSYMDFDSGKCQIYYSKLAGGILYYNAVFAHIFNKTIYGLDKIIITNEAQCGSLRIDQTPTVGTITPDKYITISCNGTSYKIAVKAV